MTSVGLEAAGFKEFTSAGKVLVRGFVAWWANDVARMELNRFRNTTAMQGLFGLGVAALHGGIEAQPAAGFFGTLKLSTGQSSVGDVLKGAAWSFVPFVGTWMDIVDAVKTCRGAFAR